VKTIAVLLRTTSAERAAEALRGAVGLTLRGARVIVATGGTPDAVLADPRVIRGIATLGVGGHTVVPDDGTALVRTADAIEVWT
jgi:hypothetical protein